MAGASGGGHAWSPSAGVVGASTARAADPITVAISDLDCDR